MWSKYVYEKYAKTCCFGMNGCFSKFGGFVLFDQLWVTQKCKIAKILKTNNYQNHDEYFI